MGLKIEQSSTEVGESEWLFWKAVFVSVRCNVPACMFTYSSFIMHYFSETNKTMITAKHDVLYTPYILKSKLNEDAIEKHTESA